MLWGCERRSGHDSRDIINWEKFWPVISDMYHDKQEIGGRPDHDEILTIKMLILAGRHGLSDYELELLARDRLSFRHFLGYPDKIPDRSTIWLFKEKLASKGKIHLIWEELQRQLDEEGYSIKRGTIQDASIISSDPGHAPADKPRGDVAKTRRSRDGSRVRWEPNRNSDTKFIRSSIRNTRSSDDSIRQLHRFMTVRSISRRKERPSTAIKGISGLVPFASMDKTMRRSVRGHPISTKDK